MKARARLRNRRACGAERKRQTVQREKNSLSGTAFAVVNRIHKRNAEPGHSQTGAEVRMHQMRMADIRRNPADCAAEREETPQLKCAVHSQEKRFHAERKKAVKHGAVRRRRLQGDQRNLMPARKQLFCEVQHHAFRPAGAQFGKYL